jgi:phage-related protein
MINPTAFPSKPLIEVTGFGTFTINGKGITVNSHNYPVTMIDLETMTAYYQDENLNSNVSRLDQIQLNPGANPIVLGSGITLRIMGRWWTI